jgi:hypothetical protein
MIDKESLAESRCLLFIVPLSLGCFQCHFAARGGSPVPFVRAGAVPRSCCQLELDTSYSITIPYSLISYEIQGSDKLSWCFYVLFPITIHQCLSRNINR